MPPEVGAVWPGAIACPPASPPRGNPHDLVLTLLAKQRPTPCVWSYAGTTSVHCCIDVQNLLQSDSGLQVLFCTPSSPLRPGFENSCQGKAAIFHEVCAQEAYTTCMAGGRFMAYA